MLLCLCVVASVGFVALITVFFRHATPRNHNIPAFNHWAIPTVRVRLNTAMGYVCRGCVFLNIRKRKELI